MATVSIEFEVRTSGNGMSKMIVDADALRKAMRMTEEESAETLQLGFQRFLSLEDPSFQPR